ncbi:MAG: TonB-dependent receptor [Myxococcales bacterium]|nr:TonB-dependent receptor [Myxococcales bacterium]
MRPSLTRAPSVVAALLVAAASARADPEQPPRERDQPPFTAPEIALQVDAEYPKEAIAAGVEAAVMVDFSLDERGAIASVEVTRGSGDPRFDGAALAAARRFRFRPARRGDRPVPARLTFQFRFAVAIVAKPKAADAAPRPRLVGRLLAKGTRAPVVGARLAARDDDGRIVDAETDARGEFTFHDLAAGRYQVAVRGSRLVAATFEETLAPGDATLRVVYYVDLTWAARYETTVRGSPERVEVARTITNAELMRMPGTFGDALRAIENLPGVARSPFNAGLLILRGGKPTDSRSFFAAAEVPQLYHFGGFTSVVPTHLVEKIDYLPGNFGARYGRAIAGVVDVDLRVGARDRLHGYIDTNAIDTGLGVEGPVGKGSFILGARRSYIDAVMRGAASLGALEGSPVRFTTAPVYYDYQAVLDYPFAGGKLRAIALGSDDELRLLFDSPSDVDPGVRGSFQTHIFFHRLQLRWTRAAGPWSFYVQASTGYTANQGSLGSVLSFSVGVLGSDWRLEARYRFSDRLQLLFGADTQLAAVFLDADVPLPPAEGQQTLPLSVAPKFHRSDVLKIFNGGLYAELVWKPTARLTISPGMRLDYYSPLSQPSLNPRLSARLQVTPITVLKAGIGLYSQDPQPFDYDPTFGNPRLRPESAHHYALTVEQGLYPGLMLEVTGFYKHLYDIVVPSSSPRLTAPDAMGNRSVETERKSNEGGGRVYGGELLLRQSLSKWIFGWVSYTVMRSERRDCAACPNRLFDFDQTHILILAVSANLPRGFGAGLRFRYISGFPYTPAHGGQFDSDAAVYVPGVAPANTARLDDYHQLDLRVDKTFVYQRWLLKIYLDVSNVYNHANQEQIQYSYDFKLQVPVTGLPIIPSFGVRGEF